MHMHCVYSVCVCTVNITEGRLTTLLTDNTHVSLVGGSVEANSVLRQDTVVFGLQSVRTYSALCSYQQKSSTIISLSFVNELFNIF